MQRLNIIHDNAADRASTIAATTAVGGFPATNMIGNDYKGLTCRSTATSVTYTLTWTGGEVIQGVGLPATNLTAAATIRVRLYSDTACTILLADSGTIYACPGLNLGLQDWTMPLNSNAFAFGGASRTAVWFAAAYTAKGCIIDLVDAGNAAGYIDCSRVVAGPVWTPQLNANYGIQLIPTDTTKSTRTDSGDNPSDRGVQFDGMSLELKYMLETDRSRLLMLFKNVGTAKNLFISVLPGNDSPVAEQDYMMYGKRKTSAGISADAFAVFSGKLELEGW